MKARQKKDRKIEKQMFKMDTARRSVNMDDVNTFY